MSRFHVTRAGKVWHNGVAQPMDAIIDVPDHVIPQLKGMGYIEGYGNIPIVPREPDVAEADSAKAAEERYLSQTKQGTVKK